MTEIENYLSSSGDADFETENLLVYTSGSGAAPNEGSVFKLSGIDLPEVTAEVVKEINSPDISAISGRVPTNHPYWLPYLVGLIIFLFCFLAVVDLLVKYYWCERRRRKQEAAEQHNPDSERGLFIGRKLAIVPETRFNRPELTSLIHNHEPVYKPRVHRLLAEESGLPMIHGHRTHSVGKQVTFGGSVTRL